jgi:hypothetical protein
LPPFELLKKTVLNDLIDPQKKLLPYAARAAIRTELGMPAETNAPAAASTNLPPAAATNAVENITTNSAAK